MPRGTKGFLIYTFCLLAALACLPAGSFTPQSSHYLFLIGYLALWRYGWGLTHYLRHLLYNHLIFPALRKTADSYNDALMPSKAYLLITSFKIEPETTIKVYRAAIRDAIACQIPTTIIASIVDIDDQKLIENLFKSYDCPDRVNLRIVRIPGTGKRDALAQGFKAISRDLPPDDAVVAVIDGDSIIEEGLIRKCVPFFKTMPNLGALTTDEHCDVKGSKLIREWHDMRFAQRQILMSSLAVSRKVLTLTGRMSMFRAGIVTNSDFISSVQNDQVDHWRLGQFRMLTGDDKSSWFWVLKNRWDMLYVPDAVVMTVEHPPHANFFNASTRLMFRWFGNMLRTNGRALALGPHRIGLFPWWCVLDQRISMWTSLSGPVFILCLALKHSLLFIPVYIVWVGLTRWVMALMLLSSRPVLSARYPFLLYYNQIWGSLIKTYVFFRLDRQSWTRQKTKLDRNLTVEQQRWQNAGSIMTHSIALTVFVALIGFVSGLMTIPEPVIALFNPL